MSPDEQPSVRRRALLVATASYDDPALAALRAPTGDVAALAAVLGDAEIGGFEVQQLIDRPTEELRKEIETFFDEGRPHDLLLLYVSGHGVLSQSRRFYFATATTSLELLRSTAIEDSFVNDVMQGSRARSIVLVLDCCHSGAFGKGLAPKSATTVDVEHRFEGQGRVTLSASTELEYAFEETAVSELDPAAPGSLFTRSVVEGLRSGDADLDEDGRISVDDLYDYVCRRVRERSVHQTPGMAGDIRGEITIAKSRKRSALPPELQRAVESNMASIRAGAVSELAALMRADGAAGRAARAALERLAEDDSRSVATAALTALGRPPRDTAAPAEPPPVPPPAEPEPSALDRRRIAVIAGVAVALVALVAAGIALLGSGSSPPPATGPYIFAPGNSAQVVLGLEEGSEQGSTATSGIAVVDAMNGGWLINDALGGVPKPADPGDAFGYAVASGDFNKDGNADLAVGVPGRGGVSVFADVDGRSPGRFIDAQDLKQPPEVYAFGAALVARDFNNDGFADLAVGAPGSGSQRRRYDHGSIYILFGGPRGLSAANARQITEADPDNMTGFGRVLAAGDVNGDGRLDLVEGSWLEGKPDAGHMSYCLGANDGKGPTGCDVVADAGSTTSLAIGNLNGDRISDVVQGDHMFNDEAGQVRVWLGLNSDSQKPDKVIDEDQRDASPGDNFGTDVAVGKVDGDQFADIVVTAPFDDQGRGTVSVIHGSADGPLAQSNFLDAPPSKGHFGAALSLLDTDNDQLPEVYVGVDGVDNLDDALLEYRSSESEGLSKPEKASGLGDVATRANETDATMYIGR
jgi:uncharacterized caspase-like protein